MYKKKDSLTIVDYFLSILMIIIYKLETFFWSDAYVICMYFLFILVASTLKSYRGSGNKEMYAMPKARAIQPQGGFIITSGLKQPTS